MKVKSMIVGLYGRSTEHELNAFAMAGLNRLVQKPLTEEVVKSILDVLNE